MSYKLIFDATNIKHYESMYVAMLTLKPQAMGEMEKLFEIMQKFRLIGTKDEGKIPTYKTEGGEIILSNSQFKRLKDIMIEETQWNPMFIDDVLAMKAWLEELVPYKEPANDKDGKKTETGS